MSEVTPPEPQWEKSPRRHGYWLDGTRIGYVGSPRAPADPYAWYFEGPGSRAQGTCRTLRQAKKAVEALFRHGRLPTSR